MTPLAKQELRAYCERARKVREAKREEWTPADKIDAFVALCCAVLFVFVVVL